MKIQATLTIKVQGLNVPDQISLESLDFQAQFDESREPEEAIKLIEMLPQALRTLLDIHVEVKKNV